jgi:hypothetical protein
MNATRVPGSEGTNIRVDSDYRKVIATPGRNSSSPQRTFLQDDESLFPLISITL